MGRHEAGKAGDPAHDFFFAIFDAGTEKSPRQLATDRAGTVIVLLTLTLVVLRLITGV